MKKKIILLISLTIFITSCKNENKNANNSKPFDLVKLSLIDSIIIKNATKLTYNDHNFSKILLHNSISNNVFIYDTKTRQTYSLNKQGNNYDNYQFILDNIRFYNDTTVVIGLVNHVNFYNLKGKFLFTKKVKRSKKTYTPIMHPIFISDSSFIFLESLQGDISKKQFYQQNDKIITLYDFDKGTIKRFADFPEKESAYNDDKYYYKYPMLFSIHKFNDLLYLNSYNDPYIYEYNINQGKLNNTYKLDLKYYTPYRKKYGESSGNISKIRIEIYQNSEIYNFDLNDSLFFVAYNKAFDKDGAIKALANDEEKRNCLHIRKRSGKILYEDFLPEYLGKFMFEENDTLYFLGKTTEKSENENYSTLYMAKLIENK